MINEATNNTIEKLSKDSKKFEKLLSKRAIIALPHYIHLTMDLISWSLRCAIKNKTEQIAFCTNSNPDKVRYFLEYLQATRDEFRDIGKLKNIRFFNSYLDLTSNESTEEFVKVIRKGLNRNKKLSPNGGVIVIDNIDSVTFPLAQSAIPSSKTVMKNMDKLTAWHKHDKYSLVFGTVTTPIHLELKQIFGGHWDKSINDEEDYDNTDKH